MSRPVARGSSVPQWPTFLNRAGGARAPPRRARSCPALCPRAGRRQFQFVISLQIGWLQDFFFHLGDASRGRARRPRACGRRRGIAGRSCRHRRAGLSSAGEMRTLPSVASSSMNAATMTPSMARMVSMSPSLSSGWTPEFVGHFLGQREAGDAAVAGDLQDIEQGAQEIDAAAADSSRTSSARARRPSRRPGSVPRRSRRCGRWCSDIGMSRCRWRWRRRDSRRFRG